MAGLKVNPEPVRAEIAAACERAGRDPAGAARGRHLDLRHAAHLALERAGVEHVEDVDLCTACHPELFFSHRRDRGVTGRQAGVVWIRGE